MEVIQHIYVNNHLDYETVNQIIHSLCEKEYGTGQGSGRLKGSGRVQEPGRGRRKLDMCLGGRVWDGVGVWECERVARQGSGSVRGLLDRARVWDVASA